MPTGKIIFLNENLVIFRQENYDTFESWHPTSEVMKYLRRVLTSPRVVPRSLAQLVSAPSQFSRTEWSGRIGLWCFVW